MVTVDEGNAFVPDGASRWETSVCRDTRGNADDDYHKQAKDQQGLDREKATLIFVTPRRWPGKRNWMTTQQGKGEWRDVRAHDADDLQTWLELTPTVPVWLSILIGKRPEGVNDLQTFWDNWSMIT